MKKLFILFLCCGAVLCFGQENLEQKEQKLLKQEKKLAKEMFELRIKFLKKDPALRTLYAKILELHKELALKLDSKKEMRVLAAKLRKLKNSIAEIKEAKEEEE